MGKRADKHKKSYVDFLRERLQLTCLIYVPGHSPYECNVLNDLGNKYVNWWPFKQHSKEPTTKKCFVKKKEANFIFQKVVYDIILHQNENANKRSNVKNETHQHENTDSEIDENI